MNNNILKFLIAGLLLSSCGESKKDKSEAEMTKTQHQDVVNSCSS